MPAACGAFVPLRDRPRADFRLACGQIADQSQKMVACADQFFQPGLFQSQIIQEHLLLIIIQLGNLFLDLRAHDKYFAVLLLLRTRALPARPRLDAPSSARSSSDTFAAKITGFACQQVVACKPRLLVLIVCRKALRQLIRLPDAPLSG